VPTTESLLESSGWTISG